MTVKVYIRKTDKLVTEFPTRKDAVYYCKVNQSLPSMEYEWEDEFRLEECGSTR